MQLILSKKVKRLSCYGIVMVLLIIAFAIIPCTPSGIYYSKAFEVLHSNNRGACIITKYKIFYVINYDEDRDSFTVLEHGKLKRVNDGEYYLIQDAEGTTLLKIKSFLWGLKIYHEDEILYAYRQVGIKPTLY